MRCYALQVIEGLEYLHAASIIHRDLKLGNVFINGKMELKIGDFGLSTKLKGPKDKRYTTCGTPNYIAPEILAESGHSFEVDIWALGVMIYTLLVGRPAFECESVEDTYARIKQVEYDFPPAIPLSEEVRDLVTSLLKKNPSQRLTLDQMKKHPFLSRELHRVPDLLPSYTITIPPEGGYLRQFGSEKVAKVTILPRRLSRHDDKENRPVCNSNEKSLKENKLLFLSSGNIRKQDLDKVVRGKIAAKDSGLATGTHLPRTYETDTNEISSHVDLSGKYGVGYVLANGSVGVAFNDGTSLTRTPEGAHIYYEKS